MIDGVLREWIANGIGTPTPVQERQGERLVPKNSCGWFLPRRIGFDVQI